MGIVFKNNAKTTLASSLSNSATSATVTDGSVFPSLSAGEFFLVTFDDGSNNEICKCTARSGNTLTIVRAQESTTARAFSSGDAAEGRVTAGVLETIQENIAAKSANQTVFNATTAGGATTYNIGTNPGVEANAMVFLNGVLQHHDTLSFSGTNLTFDAAPPNGMALEVIIDNLINLQSSNLTVDSFTAADVSGNPQTDFTLSDTPAAETNLIVFIDGVFQDQDAYTISSNTLTITTGVIAGRGVTVYVINPVNIGTPSDSTVTSAKLSGNITMPGTLTVGANDVAFDSPTFVVDNANSRVGLGTASPSVPVDIVGEAKISSHLTILDAGSLKVGTGADLVISSDGTDGTIATTNDLILTATDIRPRTDLFVLNNAANNKNQLVAQSGAIKLYYDGSKQLETFSGGIKVNTIGELGNVANDLTIYSSTSGHNGLRFHVNGILPTDNAGAIVDNDADLGDPSYRFKDLRLGGNAYINGNVGIGTTSTDHQLSVNAADFDGIQLLQGGTDTGYIGVYHDGSSTGRIYVGALSTIDFQTGNGGATDGTSRVRIDGNNVFLNGGTDARIQLGTGGAGANQVSNNTVHVRGDGTNMKLNAAASGGIIMEINGGEGFYLDSNHWIRVNGGNAQQYGDNQRTYSGSENISWSSSTSANTWTSSYYMAYQKFVEAGVHFGYSGNGAISQHFRISMMNHYTGLSVQTLHAAYGNSGNAYHTISFTSGGAYNTRTLKVVNTPAGGQNTANLSGTIYYGLAI